MSDLKREDLKLITDMLASIPKSVTHIQGHLERMEEAQAKTQQQQPHASPPQR
jgi:hypothetical protein